MRSLSKRVKYSEGEGAPLSGGEGISIEEDLDTHRSGLVLVGLLLIATNLLDRLTKICDALRSSSFFVQFVLNSPNSLRWTVK